MEQRQVSNYSDTVFESPNVLIFLVNQDGQFVKISPGLCRLLGYEQSELLGRLFTDVVHEDEKAGSEYANIRLHYFLRSSDAPMEMEFFTKNHEKIPVCLHSDIIRNGLGQPFEAIATVEVLKESEREFEAKIWEANQNLQVILDNSGDGIVVLNANGYFALVNKTFISMMGVGKEALLKKHILEATPKKGSYISTTGEKVEIDDEYINVQVEKVNELFEKGRYTYSTYLFCNDKRVRPVEGTFSILFDPFGERRGTIGILRDITERKQREREAVKAKRLESVSALAGGIANDFDTILTSIMGNIATAQSRVLPEDTVYENLIKAERDAMRAKDLIRQLLTFSMDEKLIKEIGPAGDLLKEVAEQTLKGSDVEFVLEAEPNLSPIEYDHDQLGQVFRSLFLNSEHSMPEGGTITAKIGNCLIDEGSRLPLSPGDYVRVVLEDQGIGILNEYIQDIFNPYLKQGRKRSGLVLATAYTIIRKHGGLISVESEFGSGTTYLIYLPAAEVVQS